MKISITILFLSIVIFNAYSQDPAIQWQNTIGGSDTNFITALEATSDGGYIAGGYFTGNISEDKTENSQDDFDYRIIRLDGSGNLVWQNTIGGSGIYWACIQTVNGKQAT